MVKRSTEIGVFSRVFFLFFFFLDYTYSKTPGRTSSLLQRQRQCGSQQLPGRQGAGLGALPPCGHKSVAMGLHLRKRASKALLSCCTRTPTPNLVWLWSFMQHPMQEAQKAPWLMFSLSEAKNQLLAGFRNRQEKSKIDFRVGFF